MEKSYDLRKQFRWGGQLTGKTREVMRFFGLTVSRMDSQQPEHKCKLEISPGDIVYITGASGAGKSVLFNELWEQIDCGDKVNLDDIKLDSEASLVDCIDTSVYEAMRLLGLAGICDAFTLLNQPAKLSEGQRYRFRLALALAAGKKIIFADEFCSNLDRITACSVAAKMADHARRAGLMLVLATSHDDLISDLSPDVLVMKRFNGRADVVYKK